mmetsp:Transcript_20076/g.61057  ORF Transcript_20076/g.61057 Transcript_20076/m.61057 type:complete len:212 (-) Transcript_20076:96-731(-)
MNISAKTTAKRSSYYRTLAKSQSATPMLLHYFLTIWAASTTACADTQQLPFTSPAPCRKTPRCTVELMAKKVCPCLSSHVIDDANFSTTVGCSFYCWAKQRKPLHAFKRPSSCSIASPECGSASAKRALRCTLKRQRNINSMNVRLRHGPLRSGTALLVSQARASCCCRFHSGLPRPRLPMIRRNRRNSFQRHRQCQSPPSLTPSNAYATL